jgi:ADP-L-glycero-D-manno-heptose 6-epimerase
LITGGAGFIGSNLAFYFQEHYPDAHVVVLDLFRSNLTLSNGNLKSFGHFKNLLGFRGEVISGDINDKQQLDTLKKQYRFDYIFHEAAISDTTALEQDLMIQTNVNAFKDLLDIAVAHGANMIYASSGATYGDAPSPQRVGREAPQNVYGFSKLMMDHLARQYSQKHTNISIVGLRYFNVYGPREFFKNKTASMVVQFGHQLLSGKNPRLFEGSDKIVRDFIYVEDIVQANVLAMHPRESGVFNVGTGKARSFQAIVDILQRELGTSLPCEYIPNPFIGRYQFHTEADIQSTRDVLGYAPRFELEEGIAAYVSEIKRLFEEEV